MTEWSEHVKRYAKKHKMSYREASMSAKCKESYKKKKMSPRRMKMHAGGGGQPHPRSGPRGDIEGRDPSIPPLGSSPFDELPPELKLAIAGYLECRDLGDLRGTSKLHREIIDNNLRSIMRSYKRKYPQFYNVETLGMDEFETAPVPTWGLFKRVCTQAAIRRRSAQLLEPATPIYWHESDADGNIIYN